MLTYADVIEGSMQHSARRREGLNEERERNREGHKGRIGAEPSKQGRKSLLTDADGC
jgi:hypothetical protein